jgi:ribosomal protein S12 methylthiotransferase accessory factor
MEAFELHAAETAELPFIRASYRELSNRYSLPPVTDLPLTRRGLFSEDWPYHWHLGWDLISQSEVPVPLAMVGMSRSYAIVASMGAFHVTSNGLGAGNTFLEAVAAGLYEVIERDAIACQYYAALHRGHMLPVLPDAALRRYPLVAGVLERCDQAGVEVTVYDCMVDTKVPTYAAFVYNRVDRGVGVVQGSGAHLDPEIAILRAITEGLQARLNFIAGSRDDIFRTAFIRFQVDWSQAVKLIERDRINAPQAERVESRANTTFEDDITDLLHCIQSVGPYSVAVIDLTPPDFPVHVVRVVVLGLEGYMHFGYRPGRRATTYLSDGTST